MGRIFYADKSEYSSKELLSRILAQFYKLENAEIERTKNGKPYLANGTFPLHFSVSHTKELIFIAFSESNIGLDAEPLDRKVDYEKISAKFSYEEQKEISSTETFLTHWVAKESAVKYLGGTLARDLKKLAFTRDVITYENQPLPIIARFFQIQGHVLCVCGKQDFKNVEFIPFSST